MDSETKLAEANLQISSLKKEMNNALIQKGTSLSHTLSQ